jgi:hypothetical protein
MSDKQTDSQTGSLERLHDLIVSFQPEWDHGDENWEFRFPVGRKWHYLWAKRYRNCLYLGGTHIDEVIEMTDFKTPGNNVLDAAGLTSCYCVAIEAVLSSVRTDPMAYHRNLLRALPPALRRGVIHRKFVRLLMPGYLRYDQELKPAALNAMIAMLKTPHRGEPLPEMTSGTYFKYCRIAYLANPESHPVDEKRDADGREMYLQWADGRDEGLAALPLDDAAAFDAWYNDKTRVGGHPWEIYRGGNSTHINLAVVKNEYGKGWDIHLTAFSSTRLTETCRIALALRDAGLHFTLSHADSYLKRLLAEDYVGVLPEGGDIKYGWHQFPKEFDVADCIHFSWFKDDYGKSLRPLREIRQLVSWFPVDPVFAQGCECNAVGHTILL